MEDGGADAVWTKIDEDGFDGTSWAVDKLISNGGKKDFTIPSDLKAGKYIGKHGFIETDILLPMRLVPNT